MKLQEIKTIAKNKAIRHTNLKKAELIRAIQKIESNSDCFGSIKIDECNQINCFWRVDCLTKL